MPEPCREKQSAGVSWMLSIAFILLTIPPGGLIGTLLGLLGDFGLSNTVVNIRRNPQVFADQYAGQLVFLGWAALACLLAAAVLAISWLARRGIEKLVTGLTNRVPGG